MGLELEALAEEVVWIAAGAALGAAAVLLWQRLCQWRISRQQEDWDPY